MNNRNLKSEIKRDVEFLKEMRSRLKKAQTDVTEYEYIETQINDWIDELEEAQYIDGVRYVNGRVKE